MKLIEGEISTKELLELFGTDKQKENYIKNKKLNSGNKSSIIKKASKFCEIADLGKGKFIIHKVFNLNMDDELLFTLLRGLSQYITPLILFRLLNEQDENYKMTLSFISWAKKFEIVNSNYSFMRIYQQKSSEYLNMDIDTMFDYFEKMDDCIKYYLEKILKILSNESGLDLIEFDSVTKVRKIIRDQNDEDIDILFECDSIDEIISDEDRKFVIDCENKSKEESGITDNREKFYGMKSKLYKKILSKLLIKRKILFTYQAYNIFCKNKIEVQKVLSKFDSILDYRDEKFIETFNNIFIEYIKDKANKASKREKEKYNKLLEDCETNSKEINYIKKYRLADAYINDFKSLSELTVPNNFKDLTKEIEITVADKYHIGAFEKNTNNKK